MAPALVVCAHGTDDAEGRATVLRIAEAAAELLPGVGVTTAYVDVQEPALPDEVDRLVALGHRVVVVPVLLTIGFHVEVDVEKAVSAHPGRVVSTGALGPHTKLVEALLDRVAQAGVTSGPLVVGVAGSSRASAAEATSLLVAEVEAAWPGPVSVGFLSAARPRLPDAVAQARVASGGPVTVASYLIGPGYFQRLLESAGADVATEPLADHPLLVDLVVRRYRQGCSELDEASSQAG